MCITPNTHATTAAHESTSAIGCVHWPPSRPLHNTHELVEPKLHEKYAVDLSRVVRYPGDTYPPAMVYFLCCYQPPSQSTLSQPQHTHDKAWPMTYPSLSKTQDLERKSKLRGNLPVVDVWVMHRNTASPVHQPQHSLTQRQLLLQVPCVATSHRP
jgi:hypothetical protein